MHTLALCHIFQVAADNGSEAFAAAVAEYGAPAVLAGGESDVSAYGFEVSDAGGGVMSELESLTGQVRAMEEKVVPHGGGASAGGAPAAGRYEAHFRVPTEEFPGGVDLVPIEPADALGHCSIDEFLSDSETDELGHSEYAESFVGTLCGQSTGRPQQVMGCGAPPPGLRPNFVLLACFLGLSGIGFAVAAGIGGASGGGMPAAEAQPTAVPPPDRIGDRRGIIYATDGLQPPRVDLVSWAIVPSSGGAICRTVVARCPAISTVLTTISGARAGVGRAARSERQSRPST
ncbi:hypothetical protein CYMTET_29967 [Cymbomonas tetramitiformis]|uniref:Uncharacterized protein n=1 Tax=Cymbomonas tetramitiformis TaxID=36881 RepID=A0AAE0FJX3_9CHLO|nr:hypothetical protein CYMTET_29967 [Cymbomonas tetramitiformis]